jgi:beta-glucanase (GH16 family)
VALLSGCKGGGGGSSGNAVTDMTPSLGNAFELVFFDEFDGMGGLDPSKWNIELGYGPFNDGWGNNESQLYTDSPSNVRVEGGNLVITARCDLAVSGVCGVRDGSITSARITSKDKIEFRYGKVEARIKVPEGRSTWPAFWMLGAGFPDTPWPAAGEIDIMEVFQGQSDINTTHATIHWEGGSGYEFEGSSRRFSEPLSDDFHVFSVEWDEQRIVAKIDDIAYATYVIDPETQREFLKSFFLLLNVAVGGNLGGTPDAIITAPQEMLVDWVRVYQKPALPELHVVGDADGVNLQPYLDIINSIEYGGNSVTSNPNSMAVDPLEGDRVLAMDFSGTSAPFSGGIFAFASADASCYSHVSLGVDGSGIAGLDDLTVELIDGRNAGGADTTGKAAIQLSDYMPSVIGNWMVYDIPLSDFPGVDLDDITQLGFWNPVDAGDSLLAGTLYLDDVFFMGVTPNCYGGDGESSTPGGGGPADPGTVPDFVLFSTTEMKDATWGGLDNFGSGATFNEAFAGDGSFNPVFSVTSGEGYGAGVHVAFVAATGYTAGFADGYDTFQAKVKGSPDGRVEVKLIGAPGAGTDSVAEVNVTTYAGSTDLGDGWYEIQIPYSEFSNPGNIPLHTGWLLDPPGDQADMTFVFLFTDVGFSVP